jgi:hypothetical protein
MLSFQIYTDSSRTSLLADYSWRLGDGGGLQFGTNGHGFASLRAPLVRMALDEAFRVYEWPGTPHVVVSNQATGVVWEGRLEDIALVPGGVSLGALGYQRALSDVPYTALWSKTSTADWRPVTADDRADALPAQYEMDNNNRLYVTLKKGEMYSSAAPKYGELTYSAPHLGARNILSFEADYAVLLPAGFRLRMNSCAFDFSSITAEATVTATGSLQTGTWSLTTTANQRLFMSVVNASGSPVTVTAETGDWYAKLTDIRIKTATDATILASTIAGRMAAYVNGINALHLSSDTGLIEATATDLQDEIYEDLYPAAILDRLALLHTAEWGVWEGRLLHFRPRGSRGRHWYVDVSRVPELQRSLENVRNSAYAVYRSADGKTLRRAAADDTDSQERYEVVRRGYVNVQTTSGTEADTHRDTWLADRANLAVRARIVFDRLYDAAGADMPLYAMRAGDTVTMRNLPPTLSTAVDRIRTFTVGETSYDAAEDRLDIAPSDPVPTLVTLVARREARV